MSDREPSLSPTEPAPAGPVSGVEKRLHYRRVKRLVLGGFFGIMFAPMIAGLLLMLNLPWLGMPIGIIAGLLWMLLPVAMVAFVIYVLWRSIVPNLRQTYGRAQPAADRTTPSAVVSAVAGAVPFVRHAAIIKAGMATAIAAAQAQQPGSETAGPADEDFNALLADIDRQRHDLAEQRRKSLLLTLPIGFFGGLALGVLLTWNSSDNNFWPILLLTVFGGAAGYFIGSMPFEGKFNKLFKDNVVPRLLSRHGAMQRRADYATDLSRVGFTGAVWAPDRTVVDDAFVGQYRDHRLEIAEMTLVREQQGNVGRKKQRDSTSRRTVVVTLKLDRPVPATTAVIDSSAVEEGTRNRDARLQRLELEDVVFGKVYHVYGNDQVGSRALLTPAVMGRMLAMADGTVFMPPTLLAEGQQFQFAISTYGDKDLFEPLSVANTDMLAHVRALENDLTQIFGLVDAMIDMADALPGRRAAP